MSGMLASVATMEEARMAVALGADIVDLKDPARGALGAWPLEQVRMAVSSLGGRPPLSATLGDLPMEPDSVRAAAGAMAATGVDFVKIGFFTGGEPDACVAALAPLAEAGVRLVAVLMADQLPAVTAARLAQAGWCGVMLDTAGKDGGSLRRHMSQKELAGFVAEARRHGLLNGLAGSLTLDDIPPLVALGPDYLGFRGALCREGRTSGLDPARFAAVHDALRAARPTGG